MSFSDGLRNLITGFGRKIKSEAQENLGVGEAGFGDLGRSLGGFARTPIQETVNQARNLRHAPLIRDYGDAIGGLGTGIGQAIAVSGGGIDETANKINSDNAAMLDQMIRRYKEYRATGDTAKATRVKELIDEAMGQSPATAADIVGGDEGLRKPGQIAADAVTVASLLAPAAPIPAPVAALKPLPRLLATNAIRGAETAAPLFLHDAALSGDIKESAKDIPANFIAGGVVNSVLSPKLTYRALTKPFAEATQEVAPQAARAVASAVNEPEAVAPGPIRTKSGQVIDPNKPIMPTVTGRPSVQASLEAAVNGGDYKTAMRLLDEIPANDPYKRPMEQLFRDQVSEGVLATAPQAVKVSGQREIETALKKGNYKTAMRLLDDVQETEARDVLEKKFRNQISEGIMTGPHTFKDELRVGKLKGSANFFEDLPENKPKVETPNLDKITYSTKEARVPLKERASQFIEDAKSEWFNRFSSVEDAVKGKNLKPSEDPTYLIKRYLGGQGIANQKIDTELAPILQRTDNFDDLRKYLIANRDIELASRSLKGTNATQSAAALKELQQKVGSEEFDNFTDIANRLYTWQRDQLSELVDSGIVSKNAFAKITQSNQKYVPFQRVMDDLDEVGFGSNKSLNLSKSPINAIKGSEREIIDPLESMINNTYSITKAVEKNRVLQSLADLGDEAGITPLRTAKNVNQRIDLFTQAKELKPVQSQFQDLLKTRSRWERSLTSEIDRLNSQGLYASLKEAAPDAPTLRSGFKDVATNVKPLTPAGRKAFATLKTYSTSATPSNSEVKQIVNNLANLPSPEVNKIKSLIATRENKLGPVLDQIAEMSDILDNVKSQRSGLIDEARLLKDASSRGKATVNVWRNGVKEIYEVPKEIETAVKGLDEEQLNFATRVMAKPARALRAGATTSNVAFALPNVLRDQYSAAINSKYGGVPIYDFLSGLASVIKKDDSYQRWLASGADQASFFTQDRTTIQRTVNDITEPTKSSLGKYVKNPLELLRVVSDFSEKGSRVGVFKRALQGAAKEGFTGSDVDLVAMREAREATVDFAQRGTKMKAVNAVIPFINARLQGTAKFLQSAKTRPVQTGLLGMAYAGVPAILTYIHNVQDPNYKEIPDYVKRDNFIIMTGNKETPFVKVPKGEVGKIFANPIESFLDHLRGEGEKNWLQVAGSLLKELSPVQNLGDAMPTAFKVPFELKANRDLYRDQYIVSPYQQNLPPALQFNKNTSETSKFIGDKLNVSPAKLDYAARGLGAGVAGQALMGLDYALFGKEPETQDLPVIDRFTGEQSDLRASADKIYKDEETRKQDVARNNYAAKQRIREYLRTGNESLIQEAQLANPESFKQFYREAVEEMNGEDLSPRDRAIQSLPKKEQLRYSIDPLPTTGQPTAGAAAPGAGAAPQTPEALSKNNTAARNYALAYGYDKPQKSLFKQYTKLMDDTDIPEPYKAAIAQQLGIDVEKYEARREYVDERQAVDADYALSIDRAKRNGDLNRWMGATTDYLEFLDGYRRTLDRAKDKLEYTRITNRIEDVSEQMKKYEGYGGFTKGRSGSGGSGRAKALPKVSVPSLSAGQINLPKAASIRAVSGPRRARITASPRRSKSRVSKAYLAHLR